MARLSTAMMGEPGRYGTPITWTWLVTSSWRRGFTQSRCRLLRPRIASSQQLEQILRCVSACQSRMHSRCCSASGRLRCELRRLAGEALRRSQWRLHAHSCGPQRACLGCLLVADLRVAPGHRRLRWSGEQCTALDCRWTISSDTVSAKQACYKCMQVRYWDIRQSGCLHCFDQHETHRWAVWQRPRTLCCHTQALLGDMGSRYATFCLGHLQEGSSDSSRCGKLPPLNLPWLMMAASRP